MKIDFHRNGLSVFCLATLIMACQNLVDQKKEDYDLFRKDNLLAWCIVPYDALQRGPEDRAVMLRDLGITMLAYDWREKHIPTFDEEWEALNRHGIILQAFWMVTGLEPTEDLMVREIFDFIERNNISTQLWTYIVETDEFRAMEGDEKIEKVLEILEYLADRRTDTTVR